MKNHVAATPSTNAANDGIDVVEFLDLAHVIDFNPAALMANSSG